MAAKTTPEWLREIIDLLGAAKTFEQQKAVRDSLTHDELMDYEGWTQGLPRAVQPAAPKEEIWMAQKQLDHCICKSEAKGGDVNWPRDY